MSQNPRTHRQETGSLAQRLWVLERTAPDSSAGHQDVFCFVNAMVILGDAAVDVGFVRSLDASCSSVDGRGARHMRLNVGRNTFTFATLDEALAFAESNKHAWIRRGWTEVPADPNDR
jgi:hypothetical protein